MKKRSGYLNGQPHKAEIRVLFKPIPSTIQHQVRDLNKLKGPQSLCEPQVEYSFSGSTNLFSFTNSKATPCQLVCLLSLGISWFL